jgi:CBS domain-containing protein
VPRAIRRRPRSSPIGTPQRLRGQLRGAQALRVRTARRGDISGTTLATPTCMKPYDLKVADLMSTALLSVRANEQVKEAHAEMQIGVIRHLPVVDDRGRLVGVISDRDILRSTRTTKPQRVADIMTRDVVTVRPEDAAHTAATAMLDYKISSLLVVDDTETLVGVVTMTDYLELARRALLGLPLER